MKGSDILMQNNSFTKGEIVLYQPNESIRLEVKVDSNLNTVWLSIDQMAELFGRDRSVIGKHVRAVFKEGELQKNSVWANFAYTASDGKTYSVDFYNLDLIISVGYRVHSKQGVAFRIWATGILRDYLLHGCTAYCQITRVEEKFDRKLLEQRNDIIQLKLNQEQQQKQLDFFIATNTPPAEMVFFEGDFYKARVALENLVKTAKERVVIVDEYVNALTLDILNERAAGVEAVVYTSGVGEGMQRLMAEHDRLFPEAHIDICKWRKKSHDRWLIIDDRLYHCGHSLNANGGHKISAITLMGTQPERILSEIENHL